MTIIRLRRRRGAPMIGRRSLMSANSEAGKAVTRGEVVATIDLVGYSIASVRAGAGGCNGGERFPPANATVSNFRSSVDGFETCPATPRFSFAAPDPASTPRAPQQWFTPLRRKPEQD